MNLLKKIPEKVKSQIKYWLSGANHPKYTSLNKKKRKVFVFLAGLYQNLGDMAITYAQKEFLGGLYTDTEIVLVPSTQTYEALKLLREK